MPDESLDIKLLLQGEGVLLLNPALQHENLNQRLKELLDKGVRIEVSHKNYQQYRHLLERTDPPCLVQNIFSRIIELQHLGYKYITP